MTLILCFVPVNFHSLRFALMILTSRTKGYLRRRFFIKTRVCSCLWKASEQILPKQDIQGRSVSNVAHIAQLCAIRAKKSYVVCVESM